MKGMFGIICKPINADGYSERMVKVTNFGDVAISVFENGVERPVFMGSIEPLDSMIFTSNRWNLDELVFAIAKGEK